ncbi:acetyltransferase domain-containing protein [Roseivivax marinus]|uniref:Acetyltransferase domain-containing protein n=1 Tax=Roseivivax marinus TaxID=1379903 RepID=W4HLC6_9RHOB|nr:GNAT family N-acetyltransferase [Roseivivax marinus]ETW13557.1 acetyltransferase domain-containing protein [Roseivivax marinus]UMA65140.1 GNAT family N-acetyltransferase [Roseivivax marinus]SEK56432.1 L-amino acid N-acyltransferase YncA [Roseivivax marinus]
MSGSDTITLERPVTLRAARTTDAGAVAGILGAFTDATPWLPRVHTGAEDIAHAGLMIDRGWVTLAEDEAGRVIGFLAREGDEIHALYLRDAARRAGLGTALLDRAKAVRETLALWTFAANGPARRFYARRGFREVAATRGANDEGLPDVRCVWTRRQEAAA